MVTDFFENPIFYSQKRRRFRIVPGQPVRLQETLIPDDMGLSAKGKKKKDGELDNDDGIPLHLLDLHGLEVQEWIDLIKKVRRVVYCTPDQTLIPHVQMSHVLETKGHTLDAIRILRAILRANVIYHEARYYLPLRIHLLRLLRRYGMWKQMLKEWMRLCRDCPRQAITYHILHLLAPR